MRGEIARGAAWMIMLRLSDRLLGLVSTLVLARLLLPADFGLVAMAMSFIALIELASAFGFEVALIQRPDPAREHFDTAWTLNLGFTLMCAAATAVLAPVAAHFYSEPRLALVMVVLAGGWAVQGFENIGIVNFRRRMDFWSDFRFMFGKRITGFVVTLVLAGWLQSYWALIAGQVAGRAMGVVLSYLMESYRPRFSLAARAELFSFSVWMLLGNLMGFGLARLPHFVIGRVEGSAALGSYTMAAEFARLPSTELSAPINRAVFPGLARLTGDVPALQRVFAEVMGVTVSLTLPASIGLAMLSGVLVEVVLGARWAEAAPIMSVLAFSGAIEVIASNSGALYLALGRTRLAAAMSAIKLAALVLFAIALVPGMGVMGMALAELGASGLVILISCTVLAVVQRYPISLLLSVMWRPALGSALMAAWLWWLVGPPFGSAAEGQPRTALLLLSSIGQGACVYTASVFLVWWLAGRPQGAEALILGRAQKALAGLRQYCFAKG